MKQTVLSIEQMKYLESLGLGTNNASIVISNNEQEGIVGCNNGFNDGIPSFTLKDILNILSSASSFYWELSIAGIRVLDLNWNELHAEYHNDLLKAAYQMLLWCIENGYIKTNKV